MSSQIISITLNILFEHLCGNQMMESIYISNQREFM
jgi:hypothetical protein